MISFLTETYFKIHLYSFG